MKKITYWLIGLLGAIALFCTAETQSPQSRDILVIDLNKKSVGNPYQELYEKLLYPTVRITAGYSTGSGVIFHRGDAENAKTIYILTACHVVGNESEVNVEIYGTSTDTLSLGALVVITDTTKDLALLSIPQSSIRNPHLATLAPVDYRPYIFTPVYSVGCSLGLPPRPSNGIITVINKDCWEVSSPILPGNSGGPVFDATTYQVIGVAVWVKTYQGQLITTMAGIVPIQSIYEFLTTKTLSH